MSVRLSVPLKLVSAVISVTYSLVTPLQYCFYDFQMHTSRDFVQTSSSPSKAEFCKHLCFLYGLHLYCPRCSSIVQIRTCYKTFSGIVNKCHPLAMSSPCITALTHFSSV